MYLKALKKQQHKNHSYFNSERMWILIVSMISRSENGATESAYLSRKVVGFKNNKIRNVKS